MPIIKVVYAKSRFNEIAKNLHAQIEKILHQVEEDEGLIQHLITDLGYTIWSIFRMKAEEKMGHIYTVPGFFVHKKVDDDYKMKLARDKDFLECRSKGATRCLWLGGEWWDANPPFVPLDCQLTSQSFAIDIEVLIVTSTLLWFLCMVHLFT